MNKTKTSKALYLLLFFALLILPLTPAKAAREACVSVGGLGDLITCYLQTGLDILLWIASIGSVVMIIYSGVLFMTSAGDTKKIGTAKSALTAAIIGTLIVLLSYTLTIFVAARLGVDPNDTGNAVNIYNSVFDEANQRSRGLYIPDSTPTPVPLTDAQKCINACRLPTYSGGTIKAICDSTSQREVVVSGLTSEKCCCDFDPDIDIY